MRRIRTRMRNSNTNPPVIAAYGLRKLNPSYNGPSIRVRRSSDNAEVDIGFLPSGALNETALTTHVGANSGFVSIWYDQSGNGHNMTQATIGNQPRIVNGGTIDRLGSSAALRTDGVAMSMSSASFTTSQTFTRSSVLQFLTNTVSDVIGEATPYATLYMSSTGVLTMWAGTAGQTIKTGIAVNDKASVLEVYSPTSSYGSYNGVVTSGLTPGNAGTSKVTFGGGIDGKISALYGEIILLNSALTTPQRLQLETSQKSFWGL